MDKKRWEEFSLAQQIGHVGSELLRAKHSEEKDDLPNRSRSLERALELVDFILADRRWTLRLKELTRLREVLAVWYCGRKDYAIRSDELVKYCTQLALVSKINA